MACARVAEHSIVDGSPVKLAKVIYLDEYRWLKWCEQDKIDEFIELSDLHISYITGIQINDG